MRKDDEVALFAAMRRIAPHSHEPLGRSVVQSLFEQLHIHPKRGVALIEKWCRQGWWDFGFNLLAGWFTPSCPDSPPEAHIKRQRDDESEKNDG